MTVAFDQLLTIFFINVAILAPCISQLSLLSTKQNATKFKTGIWRWHDLWNMQTNTGSQLIATKFFLASNMKCQRLCCITVCVLWPCECYALFRQYSKCYYIGLMYGIENRMCSGKWKPSFPSQCRFTIWCLYEGYSCVFV